MATVAKPLSLSTKHYTKEEIEAREKAEKMLKTSSEKVYKAPSKLNKDTKKIYKSLVEKLKPLDILTDLDIDLLCITSDAIYQIHKATEEINKYGQVLYQFDEDGNVTKATKNPAIDVVKNYEAIFKSGCSQLCMSPSARAKLSSELAELFKEEQQEQQQPQLTREQLEVAWLTGGLQ